MKKLKVTRTPGIIMALLLGLWLLGAQAVMADSDKWLLVANDGTKLAMENVGSFVLTDDAETFDILGTTGNVMAKKVKKVTFKLEQSTGIRNLKTGTQTQLLSHAVSHQLTIVGAQSDAVVYSAAGLKVAQGNCQNGQVVINVSTLPEGTYLVRTGKQTFKFIKK